MPAENQTVNPTFNISDADHNSTPLHLYINAGMQGFSCTALDKASNTFTAVLVYHFPRLMTVQEVAAAIATILDTDTLLQQHFEKTAVTWCFNETVLVPHEYFDKSQRGKLLELVFGNTGSANVKDELVLQHNLHAVYAVPAAIENSIAKKFPYCLQSQQSSLLIGMEPYIKDWLYCHFYADSLTVVLRKQGQLQVIQNFEFGTPEDVVYHVLNVCQSFDVDATQAIVTVSGMIEETSNLYNELYKYAGAINFYELPGNFSYAAGIKEHPAHYFSHLFATAACVL